MGLQFRAILKTVHGVQDNGNAIVSKHGEGVDVGEISIAGVGEAGPEIRNKDLRTLIQINSTLPEIVFVAEAGQVVSEGEDKGRSTAVSGLNYFGKSPIVFLLTISIDPSITAWKDLNLLHIKYRPLRANTQFVP